MKTLVSTLLRKISRGNESNINRYLSSFEKDYGFIQERECSIPGYEEMNKIYDEMFINRNMGET